MAVTTRASVRRHAASASSQLSRQKSTSAPSSVDQPETRRCRRSRSSDNQHRINRDAPSDAQHSDQPASKILIGGTDLTWQQQELLQRTTVRSSRRRSESRTPNSRRSSLSTTLPVLRVTNDCQLVLADESRAPKKFHRSRRSLASLHSPSNSQPDLSCTSDAKKRRRSSDQSTDLSTNLTPSQAYAEPSCFRAPMPQSLPLPCFTKSIRAVATVARIS
ncbi:uncharacterized protein UMAG_01330 [Mycosarcoma maydis]|uniref:Uncharacterized protein n=1 Tax=Mycosarcoma maydis TaxID=5270 RepID=A0A0D1E7C7_MYCMD|nr:uncharacterized protein UMAG_01330 [Ustilago maydis 521]KIS71431.1 hypothetical protein UMAG_01330 [Ustilago maydis 521]|eukprot:XP_011387236.1 hypothetical protein UMAG_01330 [Ustilago maydis 521]